MSDIAAKLDEARALIERGWCQHWGAVDRRGREVEPQDIAAVRFCAVGAISRVAYRVGDNSEYHEAHRLVTRAIGGAPLAQWNDRHTQSEVIEAFKKAAELARAEAKPNQHTGGII